MYPRLIQALWLSLTGRERCKEEIIELMTALRIIIKVSTHFFDAYCCQLCSIVPSWFEWSLQGGPREMERVTRSISQLRHVDKRQQSTSTTSTANLTFYALILIMLVYVFVRLIRPQNPFTTEAGAMSYFCMLT